MAEQFDSLRLPNPDLTPEHESWRTQVRRFVDEEIAPNVDEWDEQGCIPGSIIPRMAEMGIVQLGYPEAYGGISEGIDQYHVNILHEELSRTGMGSLSPELIHSIGLPPVLNFGSDALKQMVAVPVLAGEKRVSLGITEPGGGSDVANLKTKAVRDGDHYVVSGSKTFITGGMRADWVSTAVRTGDDGAGGVSMLLIPMDLSGVTRTPLDRKMGWWASDTATLYFDQVRVPVENLIGAEGGGFRVIMNNFNSERLGMANSMEAFSRVCIEEAITWAQERKTFGKRLADHQVIRHKIAEMVRQNMATQTLLMHCTRGFIEKKPRPVDIALLKVQASRTLEFCAREALQILGGAGFLRGNRVERIYREVRVNAIGGGSEEIMLDLAARQLGI